MNLNQAFITCLSGSTMGAAPVTRPPQIHITRPIASSETPLPQQLSLMTEMPTQAPVIRRDLKAHTNAVVNQLRSAGILKISDEAEVMVSKLMAESLPKGTTRRVLKPRTK
jgi:hypothetical protein